MPFSPLSFVLGLAAASALPVVARVFRPFAVEATAAGMGVIGDTRRLVAEQMETLEDIVAEARARRESLDSEAFAASLAESDEDAAEETANEAVTTGRTRRRANGHVRRREA
jgi:hypothetical protein